MSVPPNSTILLIAGSKVIAPPSLAGGLAAGDNGTHDTGLAAFAADSNPMFARSVGVIEQRGDRSRKCSCRTHHQQA